MVVKHLFNLILILNLSKISAQEIDSLMQVSLKLASDTERVNLFYKIGFANRAIDPQYSYACAKQAEKFAQQSSLPYFIAKASNLLGVLFYRKQDLIKALSYHKKALNLRTIIDDKKGIAQSETNLGNIYSDINYYKLAESSYLQALQLNNKLGNTKEITRCLINIAALKHTQKQDEAAVLNLKQALIYANELGNYELIATCNNNIGIAGVRYH